MPASANASIPETAEMDLAAWTNSLVDRVGILNITRLAVSADGEVELIVS
jgi:hypothetical protein